MQLSVGIYSTQSSRGVWGMLPQDRVSASEVVGDHHNHAKFVATGV